MILSQNNLEISRELLERSNPVFNTAKLTLYQLKIAGDEDAAKLIDILKLTKEETQNSQQHEVSAELMLMNSLIMESRYRTMKNLVFDSGYDTEIDMPCGYTPRAIQVTREGKHFVGLDLQATIDEAAEPILSLVDEDKRDQVKFASVDATNYTSVRAALDDVKGPVCITTEGLMMYFTDSEVEALCKTVRRILEEFGGCWISPDPECGLQFLGTAKAMFGEAALRALFQSRDVVKDKSDVSIGKNSIVVSAAKDLQKSFAEAIGIMAKYGLKVERIPIATHMPELNLYSRLTPEQKEGIIQCYQKVCYWKMTLMDENEKLDLGSATEKEMKIQAEVKEGTLVFTCEGRIDSISAPKLLAFYEKIEKEHSFDKILCDCKSLEYVSSAGLRVWLIMEKAHPESLILRGVNETVREILEQTGFSDILTIEE